MVIVVKKLTKLTLSIIALSIANPLMADDSTPNPSDLTETSTSAYFGLNNQGSLKALFQGTLTLTTVKRVC